MMDAKKRRLLILENRLRGMSDTELLRYADSTLGITPLEYELMSRLYTCVEVTPRRVTPQRITR